MQLILHHASRFILRITVTLIAFFGTFLHIHSQPNTKAGNSSVMVNAVAQASPPQITLNWPVCTTATQYSISRKIRSSTSWAVVGSITSGAAAAVSWTDNTVTTNTLYEYKVVRTTPTATGTGYIASGINVSPDAWTGNSNHYMGKIILVVASGVSSALPTEMATLRNDLKADGWVVVQHDLNGTETVPDIRDMIIADHNHAPAEVKAVYLVGHVPVPYSGDMAPDGHPDDHKGAWPCDGYYGDMDGTWTDATVNNTSASYPRNRNVPGDGKFDQNLFPNEVELQVGRLDMGELDNAFLWWGSASPQLNEAQRMKRYLDRAHAFKTKAFVPANKGVVFNNFINLDPAANGYRNIGALVGYNSPEYTNLAPNTSAPGCPSASTFTFGNYIHTADMLWSYTCGGGSWACSQDVGHTDAFAAGDVDMNSVFNMSFGSYFGDWNNDGNFLRSPLVKGNALTNVWAGVPNWWFHTMGMGEPIGRGVLMTMNNQGGSPIYTPQSSEGDNSNWTQTALMGDPTLRMVMIAPPSNLQVSNSAGKAAFTWTASSDIAGGSGNGYNVYMLDGSKRPVKVNSSLITTTSYTSTVDYSATAQYMVRAVKLHTSKTGTYWNLSLGTFNTTTPVAAKVFLGGPFNSGTGTMSDQLRQDGQLPSSEPYTTMGGAFLPVGGGGGETCEPFIFNTTGTDAIVDWVLVQLHSSTSSGSLVASQCALVQRDGDVVGMDGASPIRFNFLSGSYHIAIRHRNHLGCIASSSSAFNGTLVSVDFTNPATATWGTDAQEPIGSVHALWPGDAYFGDRIVKYMGSSNDRDAILSKIGGVVPTAVVTDVYAVEDTNMNNEVKYVGTDNDRDVVLHTIGGIIPTNTRVEQIP